MRTLITCTMVALAVLFAGHGQAVASQLRAADNAGACVSPYNNLLTVTINSEHVVVGKGSWWQQLWSGSLNGIVAEFDFTLTSPSDASDKRTFPAAKTVQFTGSRNASMVRMLNQFSPLSAVQLVDDKSRPVPTIDASAFLIDKRGKSGVVQIADAVEAISGAVPANPWASGVKQYGDLAKQLATQLGSSDDDKLALANLSLQISPTKDTQCGNRYLHDGVNIVFLDMPAGVAPLPGEKIVSMSDVNSGCVIASDAADPVIYYFAKPASGQCGTTPTADAKIVGNSSIVFTVSALTLPDKAAPATRSLGSEQAVARSEIRMRGLSLTNSEALDALQLSHKRTYLSPLSMENRVAWVLAAASRCKAHHTTVHQCF